MNKFTGVLLLGTALLAGCVDREGYYNSVREEDSHGLTSLRGQPELRYNDDWSRWPRVYGATALYPLYASAYYELVPEPKDKDRTSLAWQAYGLQQTRTAEAYDSLIKGTATVIFVAQPSEGQKKRAEEAGVKLKYTAFAREAFVFIVDIKNPVNSLSEQQVKDIFSGKVSRWNKVGGGDESIKVWQRPEDSGSQTVMKGLVMQDTPMLPAKKSTVIDLMGGLITEVADYQNTPSSI